MSASTGRLTGPRQVVQRGHNGYPQAFDAVKDPPDAIYVIGDVDALQEGLSIVGARLATPYGRSCASHFGRIAAEHGIVVISGGARGCDAASHRAALEAGGKTVVFLGGGCDDIYPKENLGLFQKVIDSGGAVVSEQEWQTPPKPYMFRLRNRLIAGLAKATLIVEAGLPSGTFSTADEALSAGRELLVVPGSISSAQSRGANRLIYQGATPIVDDESFEDQLSAIFGVMRFEDMREGSNKGQEEIEEQSLEEMLLDLIRAKPCTTDELLKMAKCRKNGEGAMLWLMEWLSEKMRSGEIGRYPNGEYGPVVQ